MTRPSSVSGGAPPDTEQLVPGAERLDLSAGIAKVDPTIKRDHRATHKTILRLPII